MASGTVLSTLLCCLREFSMAWETREGKRGSVVGTSWGLPVGNLKNRKRGARARYEAGRPENLREKRPKKKPMPNPSRDGVRARSRNRKPGTRAGQRPPSRKKKIVPYEVPQRTHSGATGQRRERGFSLLTLRRSTSLGSLSKRLGASLLLLGLETAACCTSAATVDIAP